MPDLTFHIESADPDRTAAEPLLLFRLRISEVVRAGVPLTPIHSVALRCQIRIEPGRRRYSPSEQERLLELFDTPERWGQTLRPMLWQHVTSIVKPFTGTTAADLPVPCSFDFSLAATKYFAALSDGDIPLCFLFSGTIFHESPRDGLQVSQIAWDREANFRLTADIWQKLMDQYYPSSAWLSLRKDVFEQLREYRSRQRLMSWEQTLERLLAAAEEGVTP